MMLYSEQIEDTHDNIQGRERIEWSNFWYDRPNEELNERILLVGDSTVRMVRSRLAALCGLPVDMLGTSSGLHDVLFAKQMDSFFVSEKYRYSTIFIQLGHHSKIDEHGNSYGEKDYIRFRDDYNVLIDYLQQFGTRVVLLSIFFDVIPSKDIEILKIPGIRTIYDFVRRNMPEQYNSEINTIKERKNQIIKAISKQRGLPFCDINEYMLMLADKKKTRYRHVDHIHFEDAAKDVIVQQYMKYLL